MLIQILNFIIQLKYYQNFFVVLFFWGGGGFLLFFLTYWKVNDLLPHLFNFTSLVQINKIFKELALFYFRATVTSSSTITCKTQIYNNKQIIITDNVEVSIYFPYSSKRNVLINVKLTNCQILSHIHVGICKNFIKTK